MMRKMRLVKVVVPEIVSFSGQGTNINDMEPDYRCSGCGMGIAREYECCPYCKAEFDWGRVKQLNIEKFRKFFDN